MFRNLVQLYAMLICLISALGIMFMRPATAKHVLDFSYTEARNYAHMAQYDSN